MGKELSWIPNSHTIQKSKGEVPFPLYAIGQNSPAVEHQHTLKDNMHDVVWQALT